jgi:RNA polymerase sigma-70 factor (ECF subfamily)
MSADDLPVVDRAKTGDREAFGILVRKYQRRVYATAFHMTGQHSDADDVAQEAFVRAYKGLRTFDGRADFSTWLHRIVINVALNHLRSRRRQPLLAVNDDPTERDLPAFASGSNDPLASASTDAHTAIESKERMRSVLRALSELSPTLRVTLILATVEEMPYRQIAQALEIPEGTVAWRVNQARKLLRQKLAASIGDADEGIADEVRRRTKEALGAP